MTESRRGRRNAIWILMALLLFLAADAALFYIAGMPRMETAAQQRIWEGLDLLNKYCENPDMAGWLQVDGTNINYPVMKGDEYLFRNFAGEYDDSGSLFVAEDWTDEDLCTLIHGHNMWMYGTMFHPLHDFADGGFFQRNRNIRFYTVGEDGLSAEKRTYEIFCCIRTRVDEWNYASCRNIAVNEELDAFAAECRSRALQKCAFGDDNSKGCNGLIVLSTCSYHVRGDRGRLLVVGELTDRRAQTRIDVRQREKP